MSKIATTIEHDTEARTVVVWQAHALSSRYSAVQAQATRTVKQVIRSTSGVRGFIRLELHDLPAEVKVRQQAEWEAHEHDNMRTAHFYKY